jgi:hypothetical protein
MDRMGHQFGDDEVGIERPVGSEKLDGLWAEFRSLSPDPEVSAQFMPNLWQKIEARRVDPVFIFRRFAKICVMATVAVILIFALSISRLQYEPGISTNYVDALDAAHAGDYVEVADAL